MMMFLCSLDPQVLDVSGFECKMDLIFEVISATIVLLFFMITGNAILLGV
jgi:hypothetical protein